MRCSYCRSVTHEKDCPKEYEDKILPLYSAVHKLSMIEMRALRQQSPLYGISEAKALIENVKSTLRSIVEGENAKNIVEQPLVAAKNNATSKKSS
jgi:hypothetical protein